MKKISIIAPFFNEEKGCDIFFNVLIPILVKFSNIDYEIICINDGSSDNTLEILKNWHIKNNKIKIYSFSRNFGKEIALTCGIDMAKGDCVIPIDSDLQDPPNLIPQMIEKWQDGFKVVLMQRKSRDEGFIKKITASLFYKIIDNISDTKIYPNVGDFRLMDRIVIDSIKNMKEQNRFMKGILSWSGFKTCMITYDRPNRLVGIAKQNYIKLIKLALDGIFSFSSAPLKIWTYFGFFISIFAFIYGSAIILQKLIYNIEVPGYPSIMTVILFLGGIQLISIGVLGEYISRIFIEVKKRPLYILEEVFE